MEQLLFQSNIRHCFSPTTWQLSCQIACIVIGRRPLFCSPQLANAKQKEFGERPDQSPTKLWSPWASSAFIDGYLSFKFGLKRPDRSCAHNAHLLRPIKSQVATTLVCIANWHVKQKPSNPIYALVPQNGPKNDGLQKLTIRFARVTEIDQLKSRLIDKEYSARDL